MMSQIQVQNHYLRYIRDIAFACLGLWLVNPQASFSKEYYNWNIYGVILLVWIVNAFITDSTAFTKTLNMSLLIWLWPCYLLLASLFGHAEFSIKQFTTPFILVFFVYYYLAKRSAIFKFGMFLIFTYALIIAVNTISANILDPQVSRYLAHGNAAETYSLSSPFLANFFFVYAMTGGAVAFAALFKNKYKHKALNVVIIALWALLLVMFIQTEYMIATITVLLISVWILIMHAPGDGKSSLAVKKSVTFGFVCIAIIIIGLNSTAILQFLYNKASGDNIRLRLSDLISISNQTSSASSLHRAKLYMASISTFFSSTRNFFLGVGYDAGISLIGQHSQIFDTFGRYGIIGGMCWLLGVIRAIRVLLNRVSVIDKKVLKFVYLEFLIISLVNPTYNDLLLMFFFFIIPEITVYLNSKRSQLRTECKNDPA